MMCRDGATDAPIGGGAVNTEFILELVKTCGLSVIMVKYCMLVLILAAFRAVVCSRPDVVITDDSGRPVAGR